MPWSHPRTESWTAGPGLPSSSAVRSCQLWLFETLSDSPCKAELATGDRLGPAQPFSDDELNVLRRQMALTHERDLRARERARARPPGEFCFALLGVAVQQEHSLGEAAMIRSIDEPPYANTLLEVIRDKSQAADIGRWIGGCRSELVIARELAEISDPKAGLELGWNAIAALRICSDGEFLVPGVSDRSWDTIAGCNSDECWAQVIEDSPNALRLGPATDLVVSTEQAEWIGKHFEKLLELRAERRFHFALQSLSDNQSLGDLRMMAAMLWSGLEALLDVSQEIRFRISALLAVLTTPRGPSRYLAYKDCLKLYDARSKAVHGASMSKSELVQHVLAVRALLRRSLTATLEHGRVFTRDELEAELLGA